MEEKIIEYAKEFFDNERASEVIDRVQSLNKYIPSNMIHNGEPFGVKATIENAFKYAFSELDFEEILNKNAEATLD